MTISYSHPYTPGRRAGLTAFSSRMSSVSAWRGLALHQDQPRGNYPQDSVGCHLRKIPQSVAGPRNERDDPAWSLASSGRRDRRTRGHRSAGTAPSGRRRVPCGLPSCWASENYRMASLDLSLLETVGTFHTRGAHIVMSISIPITCVRSRTCIQFHAPAPFVVQNGENGDRCKTTPGDSR